jgi:aminocarboxymuconate-semialdehyde decarboxylase
MHCHYLPEAVLQLPAQSDAYHIHVTQGPGGEVLHHQEQRVASFDREQMYSVTRRLQDMDAQGIDVAAISVPPFGTVYDLEPQRAAAVCRIMNDHFAQTVASNPQRFAGLANLPMQDPPAAARELERAVKELGMRGAEIMTNIHGTNLDDKELAPFYTKMQELDVPVFIHPNNVLGQERLRRYHLANLIGNPTDTAVAAASLIFGGVLKEFPRLKFYLAHGGGTCPYIRGRWEHGWHVRPEAKINIQRPPSEYFRLLYFDSLAHSVPALTYLVETVGPERVVVGTDYPFDMGDYDSAKTIASIPRLTDAQRQRILGDNAAELLKL